MSDNNTVHQQKLSSKNKFKIHSITRDLTSSLVVMVALVSLIVICSNYFYTSYREDKRLEDLADEYKSRLTETLELPIWTLDQRITSKIAESYFNNEHVAMIQIFEKFYDSNQNSYDKIVFEKFKTNEFDLITREFEVYHNGRIIGKIKFGLTRRLYQEALHKNITSNILILLAVVLSLILVTRIFLRLLVKRPLDSLLKGINQFSRGNYDYQFTAYKQNEIQTIISNFKHMAGQIRGREKSLADMNKKLELEIAIRKKNEKMIRNNEAQLRATFEASAAGILVMDKNGTIINANDRFYRMWRITDEHRNEKADAVLFALMEEQLKKPYAFISKIKKMYKTSEGVFEELYLKDQSMFEYILKPLMYGGEIVGSVFNFRDVTDLKKSILALRESEERFRQLSEAALEAIIIHDNGIVLQANDQFFHMFGYNRKRVVGILPFIEIIDSEHRELIDQSHISNQMVFLEVSGLRKDGTTFPIVMRSKAMIYYGKNVTVTVIRDISERKAAEEEKQSLIVQLARSQKMEALGLLAGGVAHDLNNILSGIVSYPELLLMREGLDKKTRKALKTIQESGERAAAVVNDLTTISRGIASNREVLSLNSIVDEYLKSPEFHELQSAHPDVSVQIDLEPDLFNVNASRLHIRKSIMNLVANASEAIETKGEIVISTQNCYLDQPLRSYSDVQIGEYAVLSISDTGGGISEQEIDRIFEPFYTKKVMGRSGTGLGLTVVWNTVKDHSGYIVVASNLGETRFDLYFSITRESVTESIHKIPVDKYMGNGERILVVDDEKNQRNIACEMLQALGYKTVDVPSGEKAIQYIKKNSVDLILLDMIMPTGMNGRKTYKEIIKHSPGQKAIIASGFSVTEDVTATIELGVGQFLKKPYNIEKLGVAVKDELSKFKKLT